MHTLHKKSLTLLTALTLMTGYALADISLPLKPGYVVHTMGMSPVATDGNATLRIYNARGAIFDRNVTNDFDSTYTSPLWDIGSLGNVYGIAIDQEKNIYTTASASWSPGYLGAGNGDDARQSVTVGYGAIGAGTSVELNNSDAHDTPVLNDLNASGTVYRIDARTGVPSVFAHLPQKAIDFTNQVCEGTDNDIVRHTGPGLGNIVYDKFHKQFFVSNFSDGLIYRLNSNGDIKDTFDTGLGGIGDKGAPYGLGVSPDGTKLYYGTQTVDFNPKLYAIRLTKDGDFNATAEKESQGAELVEQLHYTQNIDGDHANNGVWAAYSDIDFTPNGEMILGIRVGCKGNFATSYNHGGVSYLLKKDSHGKYNLPAEQVPGYGTNDYSGPPKGSNDKESRSGEDRYDAGAIPMRANGADTLATGPDDGYGGVAVWTKNDGSYDIFLSSGDITNENGVHGFMQIKGDFEVNDGKLSDEDVAAYKSTDSALSDSRDHDYKGIGGDVEVLSVVPVSVGSCVWEDTNKNGLQDDGEPGIGDVHLVLLDEENNTVDTTKTDENCTYHFDNLPEGKYRVCITSVPTSTDNKFLYTGTPIQNGADDNDTVDDSNFMSDSNCSGLFSVFANSEPTEEGDYRGDEHDDAHDSWGNMTIDFGYVKNIFDLALIKTLDENRTYKPGEDVTFDITVYNQGNVDAKNVQISDYIPEGLSLNDPNWVDINGTAMLKSGHLISAINAGEDQTVQITFKIKDTFEGDEIINVAEIASSENKYNLTDVDSNESNKQCDQNNHDLDNDNDTNNTAGCDDLDPAKITVEQTFDLALVKTVKNRKEKYKRGESVTFTIAITNQGTITGKNIQIEDKIPDGLELADSNWEQNGDKAILKNPIASLAPKTSVSRDITFKIKEDYTGDKITNIAEIASADNDRGLDDKDSTPGDNACGADTNNDDDISSDDANKNGCDDVDPAWITVEDPNATDAEDSSKSDTTTTGEDPDAPDTENSSKSDSSSADTACDCAGVEGNAVDAMSTWMAILLVLSVLMAGFLQSREEWGH